MSGRGDPLRDHLRDTPSPRLRRRIEENLPILLSGAALFIAGVLLLATHSASRIGLLPSWSYLFAVGAIMLSGGSMATLYGTEPNAGETLVAPVGPDRIVVSRTAWNRLNSLARANSDRGTAAPEESPSWLEGAEPSALRPSLEAEAVAVRAPIAPAARRSPPPPVAQPSLASPPAGAPRGAPAPPAPPPLEPMPARPGAGPIDQELEQLFKELNTQASSPLQTPVPPRAAPINRPTCRGCGRAVPQTGPQGSCSVCGSTFCESCSTGRLALTSEGTVCEWCRALAP
ncbi:MAG TPA: hypothetical protein VGU43_04260 [Thermoplasmata archaeon]|nr:hypothetical protein [Thermoplasmata archaeon]